LGFGFGVRVRVRVRVKVKVRVRVRVRDLLLASRPLLLLRETRLLETSVCFLLLWRSADLFVILHICLID